MKGNRSFWTWMWKKKDKKEKSVVKSNDKKSSKTQMKVKEKKEDKEKSKGKKKTSKKGKEKESNGGEGEEEEKETGETKPPAPIDNRVVALAVFIATFTTATNFFLPGVFNVESSSKGPADNSNSIGSGYVTGWKICNMFALINAMCVLLIQATLIAPFHTPMTEKITKEMGNFLLWIATGFMVGGFMAIMHGISYAVKENLPRQLATFSVVYVAIIMATMIFLKFWAIYWCVKAYLNKRKEEKEKKKKEEEDEE